MAIQAIQVIQVLRAQWVQKTYLHASSRTKKVPGSF